MQIKKIQRSKKNVESVTEEKFALLFQSKFQTADMQFKVRNSYSSSCFHFSANKFFCILCFIGKAVLGFYKFKYLIIYTTLI